MRAAPVITTGEPAGIGPEIALRAALQAPTRSVLLGDYGLLRCTAQGLGISWPLPTQVQIEHVPLGVAAVPGRLDQRNARYVLALLDRAVDGCRSGTYRAMITAPVQKSIINEAGIPFTGHTEYLQQRTATAQVVMLLVGASQSQDTTLRVALATTHLPLAKVPGAITNASLSAILDVLHRGLVARFRIERPRIGVAGLNPHAGEGGHLGREELEVISPALEAARRRGIDVAGPLPADTLFVPNQLARFDAVLAMFHDQGLPVLKHATFGHGVNVTLGLPFVRTSVDHGTALDLAGSGHADAGSMVAALALALELSAAEPAHG